MVDNKSSDFLPNVFRTNTNKRFLNATLDQLIQEPNLKRIYGYIGRQELSPAYQAGDPYVEETDSYSQFYQLEPGLVVNKRIFNTKNFKTDNAYTYVDLLNAITTQGGITNNHDRLFNNEYYNYEGFVDLDKLVNYGNYYWLPNGPRTLDVNSGGLALEETFTISRPLGTDSISSTLVSQNVGTLGYSIDVFPGKINPTITLVRGGNYNFRVGQQGHPFFIQTEPGVGDGTGYQNNINKQQVFGVFNNGVDSGTVTFNVPKKDAQIFYENIPQFSEIDLVTDLPYSAIQGANFNNFVSDYDIDGNKSIATKLIVINNEQDDQWAGISLEQRKGIWQLAEVNGTIVLTPYQNWPSNTKLFVREGVEYGHLYIFKDSLFNINKVPNITSTLDILYYQDGADASVYGEIRIVDQGQQANINISDIIDSVAYTSPNGVQFTNGLKIKFTNTVTPVEYINKEFIVEGVGTAIQLVPYEDLITPDPNNPNQGTGYSDPFEPYDVLNYDTTLNAPLRKDYIIINRSSIDGNAWSRTNRWFHEDVIKYAATFDNPDSPVILDNNNRAIRPIVEFVANLRLINHGYKYAGIVTAVDDVVTDISNQVQGRSPYVLIDGNGNYYSDNVALENDTLVIFLQERYPNTKNKIYRVKNIKPYTPTVINKATVTFAPKGAKTFKFSTANDLLINMKVVGLHVPDNTVIMDIDYDDRTITVNNSFGDDVPLGTVITFNSNNIQVHLIPEHEMLEGENVVAISGVTKQNKTYWWNNSNWQSAQQKFSLNQAPLFDLYDLAGNSFSDPVAYPSSNFIGSKLFGYKEGTGARDNELGFALSYKSIGNIGDIVFNNFYDTDTFIFNYINSNLELNVNFGFAYEYAPSDNTIKLKNNWTKIKDLSKQYIQKKFTATKYKNNNFQFNVTYVNSTNEKNIFVYVNNKELTANQYALLGNSTITQVNLTDNLAENDVLVINIYGVSDVSKENYTLPKNLTDNSENKVFTNLTLGQIRNHLTEITKNCLDIVNNSFGSNNIRDINYKIVPGKILQHSAGLHLTQLLFNNETTNIIKAIDFSRKSYNRFKDRLLFLVSSMEFENFDNPRLILDTVMEEIVANSSQDQPFYYTDMMPYGINKYVQNDYPVYDTNYRNFNLITPYDINEPTYQSVLVYLNGNQLLKNYDYVVNGAVVILNLDLELNIDDVVGIYEYANTQGSMIPATPTKIGLYPKFKPEIISDDSYQGNAVNVIQGHDGSKTIAFGDFRDQVLLEYEKRIYNNINVTYNKDSKISFTSVEPGAFRNSDYNINEWTQLLSGTFLNWAGVNGVDVFTNTTATQNDAFSFNYGQAKDKLTGETVPGYWRGIYKYFFDTDLPHLRPWEMLGFSEEPDWWIPRYGPAPYTAGNLVLWRELEQGLVYQRGYDSYIDSRYARPGLTEIIPVDEHGNLLAPLSSVVNDYNQSTAGSDWRFGDQSPQETAWRRSSDYAFSIQIAWALAKPAEYCAFSLNTKDITIVPGLDQIINQSTGKRQFALAISDATNYIPGSNIWLRDNLSETGLDIESNFIEIFENYKINLIYKTSGYTDKSYLQLLADQTSPNSSNTGIIIPDENYNVVLTKSSPVAVVSYSVVIVQRTSGGFRVYGMDTDKPYFVVIPRKYNNNFNTIKVSNSTALYYKDEENSIQVIPYGTLFTTVQQVVDFLASYGSSLASQGFIFDNIDSENQSGSWVLAVKEFLYWLEQGWDLNTVLSITPAGTRVAFDSAFGVVDDLTNTFNNTRLMDSDGKTLQIKDFVTFREDTKFELKLRDLSKGIHFISMAVVLYEHAIILDNTTVFNDVIYEPSLGNRQFRIKTSGFKTSGWNGSLAAPGFLVNFKPVEQWLPVNDYRKGEIVTNKNIFYVAKSFIPGVTKFNFSDWLEIDGSLLQKQLIPNMTSLAKQFENFYDIDQFDLNASADMAARNATGFVPRSYLKNIGLDTISQHKFYLGMIREKGTQAAVNAFLRAKLPYLDNNIKVDEQWAIRLGSYGGVTQESDIELSLENIKQTNGNYIIELIDNSETPATTHNSFRARDLLIKPAVYNKDIFSATEINPIKIPQSGPVLIDEVATTVFNILKIYKISGLVGAMGEGSRIWVAADARNNWNVFRIASTSEEKIKLEEATVLATTNEIEIRTDKAHNLQVDQLIMLKNARLSNGKFTYSGFYRLNSVTSNSFKIPVYPDQKVGSGTFGAGASLFVLKSVKYNNRNEFSRDVPVRGWQNNDIVWISDDERGTYSVIKNSHKWIEKQALTPVYANESDNFGRSIDLKNTQEIMIAGAPEKDVTGRVYFYGQNPLSSWDIIDSLAPDDAYADSFGWAVKFNDIDKVVIGAPDSNGGTGFAYIASTASYVLNMEQVIYVESISSSAQFGKSVAASYDGNWIAIGAPGINTVYIYKFTEVATAEIEKTTQADTQFFPAEEALGLGLTAEEIKVRINGRLLVPYIDYTFGTAIVDSISQNDVVTLLDTPAYDDVITITYENYYKYVSDFTNDEVDGSFGASISLNNDGTQLVVGAPQLDNSAGDIFYASLGAAYIYYRSIESFLADGVTSAFTVDNTPIQEKVIVNGIVNQDYVLSTNTFTLSSEPAAGSIITFETNNFNLLEKKLPSIAEINMKFGTTVAICSTSCSVYVGAPGYSNNTINNGAVFRFVNTARLYGSIVGNNNNPLLNAGDSIRINNFKIVFTSRTSAGAAQDINNAGLTGITAQAYNTIANLIIKANILLPYNNLVITPSDTNTFGYLGLVVFDQDQIITNNSDQYTVDFGSSLFLSPAADKIVVGASTATNKILARFDLATTTFDSNSTRIINTKKRSGSAYLFEYISEPIETPLNHGKFVIAQTFSTSTLDTDHYFSTGIAFSKNWVMVSALKGPYAAGTIYTFRNKSGLNNWDTIRNNPTSIDSRKIKRLYLYNDNNKTLIADLPIIDPEHGMPVKAAVEQIKYVINYDPAVYSNTPNSYSFARDSRKAWAEEHVGDLWWDINALKYVDWYQGNLIQKASNWGLTFPYSYVTVYEWMESDVAPSIYAKTHLNDGPAYTVSSAFTIKTVIDPKTLKSSNKYYFWVRNSNKDSNQYNRSTALQLQNLISNPRNGSEPFAAIIGTNALVLFNCQDIVNNDVRLHISLRDRIDQNPIHQEWSMFDDGTDLGVATEFLDRLNDSLAEQDYVGKIVPDINLKEKEKYGLSIRPRQSTFIDGAAGRQIYVENVNAILKNYPITLLRDISNLKEFDPYPVVNNNPIKFSVENEIELEYYNKAFYVEGDQVLVKLDSTTGGWSVRELRQDPNDVTNLIWEIEKVQSYDLKNYWTYSDWYANSYNENTAINKTVNYEYEILNSDVVVGNVVKVKYGDNGQWKLILVESNKLTLIGQQNASIQLSNTLFNNLTAGFGLSNLSFEVNGFSRDCGLEFRRIFEIINFEILNKELRDDYKKILGAMLDSIASQFKLNDWLFKTSLINITHRVRPLDPIPVYVKSPENIVEEFIKEVKPYHTKIKQYLSTYDKIDLAGMDQTDFDLPGYYNDAVGKYRSPQLGNNLDALEFQLEETLLNGQVIYQEPTSPTNNIYSAWYYNHKYSIERINIFDGGSGYNFTADIEVKIIGDGTGARATAFLRNGSIADIVVDRPGKDYTYAIVEIISAEGTGAKCYAKLGNGLPRTFATTIKFDRFTYESTTQEWQPETTYGVSDLIIYNNTVYRMALSSDGTVTNIINTITTDTTFNFNNLIELSVRIWEPDQKYPKDSIVVYNRVPYVALTDFTSGKYFIYNNNITVTHAVEWQSETTFNANQIISHNGAAYKVVTTFTTLAVFDEQNLIRLHGLARYPGGYFDDAASRVWAYYVPDSGMPGRDLAQVMAGIEYPGVNILGPSYNQNLGFGFARYEQITYDTRTFDENGLLNILGNQQIDSVLYSLYQDTQLGIRTEDMITDGAAYLDTNNSHAPEEFVPGYMFDSLNIRVKTISASLINNAPEYKVLGYYADDSTSVFSFDPTRTGYELPIGGIEGIRVFDDMEGIKAENVDYIVDRQEQTITFNIPPSIPSSIFITLIGASGTDIIVDEDFIGDGIATEFTITDVLLTRVKQAYVKINGTKSIDWILDTDQLTGNILVRFDNAPALNAQIQVHLFSIDLIKAYSEILKINDVVPNNYIPNSLGYSITLPEVIQYKLPWEINITIRVNGTFLEPSNQAYYTGNGATVEYSLPLTRNIDDVTLITETDIIVTVNGILKNNLIDYTIFNDGVAVPTVTFTTAPGAGDKIVVSNKNQSDYKIYFDENAGISTCIINDTKFILVPGDRIDVVVYSNHDQYNVHTQVYSGQVTTVVSAFLGFDIADFDIQGFDTEKDNIIAPVYTFNRAVTNINNVEVTLNGILLLPYYDYVFVTPTLFRLNPLLNVSVSDIIVVRHVSEETRTNNIEYRIFKGITETYEYLGISKHTTTILTRELLITDDWIYVENTDVLTQPDPVHAKPGIVFINGERITFYVIDFLNKRLGQLRRATNGTGAPNVHRFYSNVYDGGFNVEIPQSRDSYVVAETETILIGKTGQEVTVDQGQLIRQGHTWYDTGTGSASTGLGLENSNTIQVNFLKEL